MPKRAKTDRPRQKEQWVGLGQIEKWKREAAPKEYGEMAFEILNSAGKVTRQAYLEMMFEMEERFPGYGWIVLMDDLEAYYCKRGLSLKEMPMIQRIEGLEQVA